MMVVIQMAEQRPENKRQAEAFDYYYSLGPDRTYDKVAEYIGRSRSSVLGWANKYKWKDRVIQRDRENNIKLFKRTDNEMVDRLEQYRKAVLISVLGFLKDLKEQKIKIKTVPEFVKMVELDMKLMELQDKQRDNGDSIIKISIETRETMGRLLEEIKDIAEPMDEDGDE